MQARGNCRSWPPPAVRRPAGRRRDRSRALRANDPRPLAPPFARATGRNRARARVAPDTGGSRRLLSLPGCPEEAPDRVGKPLPDRALICESTLAALGQLIDASAPSGIGGDPSPGEEACLLEPVEHRIDRSFGQVERTSGPALDLLDDG